MKKIFIPLIIHTGKRIEKKRFTEAPIYIGGCGRSGTTLLLSILSAHPDIFACPKELNLFEDAKMDDSGIHTPKFYRLYRTFITKRIKNTANRYCEKSPVNIHHIELIDKLHNGSFKLIHIIRDGRDVVLSKHPRGNDRYWVEPERWVNDVSTGLTYANHPNVHTIKYEELVTDFEKTVREICVFLNISASEAILHWHRHTTVRRNNALFTNIREINTSSIGKWKLPKNKKRASQLTDNREATALLKKLKYI